MLPLRHFVAPLVFKLLLFAVAILLIWQLDEVPLGLLFVVVAYYINPKA